MTEFVKMRLEEQGLDRGIETTAFALFQRYAKIAEFLWLTVDERRVDASYVKGAASFVTLSRGLGYWTTGRLSTYLKMVLLGLTVFLIALVWGWYGS